MEKKEETKENNKNVPQDELEISPDVVASIAGVAISEVIGANRTTGIFEVFKTKNKEGKGIRVEIKEKKCKIDANIVVDFGTRIPDIAFEIQTRVKKSVEAMTGLEVREVNVHVQGINMNVENKEQTEEDLIIDKGEKDEKNR